MVRQAGTANFSKKESWLICNHIQQNKAELEKLTLPEIAKLLSEFVGRDCSKQSARSFMRTVEAHWRGERGYGPLGKRAKTKYTEGQVRLVARAVRNLMLAVDALAKDLDYTMPVAISNRLVRSMSALSAVLSEEDIPRLSGGNGAVDVQRNLLETEDQ